MKKIIENGYDISALQLFIKYNNERIISSLNQIVNSRLS